MPVTLANATLAQLWPAKLESACLTVDGGKITRIAAHLPDEPGEVIDCSGRLVMPGNICSHTHLYSALARGMPPPVRNPRNFPEILEYIWWRLDRALDEESLHSSALVGVLDAARAGTTTLVDHHSSPNCIAGSLDILAGAFETVGVRGILCYEVTDRGGSERSRAGRAENERFLHDRRPLLRGAVGAHASFTLEPQTLEALADLAVNSGAGVHIHVAEDVHDEEDSMSRYGKRVADRLADAGILRHNSILAHGVHLDPAEIRTIRQNGSWLVHNCRSNLNNCVGHAPTDLFGGRVALGTDGIDGDMFAESRTAFFRAREADLASTAERYVEMLARGGALASEYFHYPIGRLEPGAAADLMVLRYDPPTPLHAGNLAWHWMFGMASGMVESVMVGGAWVVRDGEFPSIDEEKIRAHARDNSRKLWAAMEAL